MAGLVDFMSFGWQMYFNCNWVCNRDETEEVHKSSEKDWGRSEIGQNLGPRKKDAGPERPHKGLAREALGGQTTRSC